MRSTLYLRSAASGQQRAAQAALRTTGSIAHQAGVEHSDVGLLGLLREEGLALLVGAGLDISDRTEQSDLAQHAAKTTLQAAPKQATAGS